MALINKIREKTGLAVGVIAFGLILFLVGGDLLGPNSLILGQNKNIVGEIAGTEIDYEDFSARVESFSNNYARNYGRNPSSEEMASIRDQVWRVLINEITYDAEFEALGLQVSDEEIEEMVKGDNISPLIRQAFGNPQTGQFNKQDVLEFTNSLSQRSEQERAQWLQLEKQLGPDRLYSKYQNLLINTNYITQAEAEQDYKAKASTANVSYLYVPFLSVSDSAFEATDAEMASYISENESEFEVEETRDISYVTFKVVPSATDSALAKEELDNLYNDLVAAENDSLFALRNSEAFTPYKSFNDGNLPQQFLELENLEEGLIVGPVQVSNNYVLYKLSEIGERTTDEGTEAYYKIAQIEKEIYPSDETINKYYRDADIFATGAANSDEFKANAEKEGLEIKSKSKVGTTDRVLNTLVNAREIVFWAFNEAEQGDVSSVYDLDNTFVVATVTGKQEKGTASVDAVRNEVRRKVLNKKIAEDIKSKLAGLSGSLEDMAAAYGDAARVLNMTGLRLSSNTLNGVASAPEAIGMVFALEAGERTGAIAVDNGVVIVQVDDITPATDLEDYTSSKDQVAQSRQISIRQNIAEAIKEYADIEDNRYKFY